MTLDPQTFRATLGRFASGITIITTRDGDGRDYGMTVSAFSSLSLTPPLVLVCIDNAASVAPVLEHCESFAVNILAEDQEAHSRRFANKEGNRFEGVALRRGERDLPLLEGALAHLECRVSQRVPGGDHTILIGEVYAADVREANPLLYYRGAYRRLNA
jgi:flavin reductase ActVB